MDQIIKSMFIGYFTRSFIFLYLGYTGMATYSNLSSEFVSIESLVKIVIGAGLFLFLIWIFYKRGKGKIHDWFKGLTSNKGVYPIYKDCHR